MKYAERVHRLNRISKPLNLTWGLTCGSMAFSTYILEKVDDTRIFCEEDEEENLNDKTLETLLRERLIDKLQGVINEIQTEINSLRQQGNQK